MSWALRWVWRLFVLGLVLALAVSLWDYQDRWHTPGFWLRNLVMLWLYWAPRLAGPFLLIGLVGVTVTGRGFLRWKAGVAALLVVVGLWSSLVEPGLSRVRQTTITGLPPGTQPVRLAVIADIHWGLFFRDRQLDDLVDRLNAMDVDAVIVAGDWTHEPTQDLRAGFAPLSRLRHPVWGVLGNHDIHCLAVAAGVRKSGKQDTLQELLAAPDAQELLDWLRQQPLARSHRTVHGDELLMVHAGVLPQWTAQEVMDLAGEVHTVLRSAQLPDFLQAMYGNQPDRWSPDLQGWERLRVIVNALTRLRFCSAQGVMDFDSTESAEQAAPGLMPWFDVPGRATAGVPIAFGHWSTLGHINRPDLVALDTGCVWGGCLSMMRFGDHLADRELIQVDCPQAQAPG